jgi:hypothetical protein
MAALSESRASPIILARSVARPAVILGTMIVATAVARAAVAWHHSVPRYFPDEYVYASLGRSIAHGQLRVNGLTAFFPALVAPALTAPIWGAFPLQTAYHLVQVENAVFASLAAIPVYLLGRRLGLGTSFSLLCSAYALVTPTLVMIPFNLTDFAAYPLVLTAVLCAQRALERPTRSNQLLFVGFAAVTTLARTEYFVLVPAYVATAFILDRRSAMRRHLTAFVAILPAVVAVVVGSTGYFALTKNHVPVGMTTVTQIGLQAFLMTIVAGVVIVPGAIVGLWRPPDRPTAAFAWMTAAFTVLLIIEIGAFSVATPAKFRERYLFAIVPLLALAFGVYLKRRCPNRWGVFLLSVALAIAAARVPVSAYSTGAARFDSETLVALEWLQKTTAVASTSFLVAGLLTLGGVWATLGALRGRMGLALPFAILLAIGFTVVATHQDLRETNAVRRNLPADIQWVDRAAGGPFTAIGTPLSSGTSLLQLLYWNPDVRRYLLLDDADLPIRYAGPRFTVGRAGSVPAAPGFVLLDSEGTQATFANGTLVKTRDSYQLWHTDSAPRLRTLVEGIWTNGWLIAGGRMRAWPRVQSPGAGVRLSFDVGVPPTWPGAAILKLNGRRWVLAPGKPVHVACSAVGELSVTYASPSTVFDKTDRPVSVQVTHLHATDLPATSGAGSKTVCLSPRSKSA